MGKNKTVGDRYRAMDNSALADYFSIHHTCMECVAYADNCDSEGKTDVCRQRWLDYLNKETKNGNEN